MAETVASELLRLRDRGVAVRWEVLRTDSFVDHLDRLLHISLHGIEVGGGLKGSNLLQFLRDYGERESSRIRARLQGSEVVVLHDPLSLLLAPGLRRSAGRILWRNHTGHDWLPDESWSTIRLLMSFIDSVDKVAFVRRAYVWPHVDAGRAVVLPPGLNPATWKNRALDEPVLDACGKMLVTGRIRVHGQMLRDDGRPGAMPPEAGSGDEVAVVEPMGTGFLRSEKAPFVLQVARWDSLKGHEGALRGFSAGARTHAELELVLLGPHVDPRDSYPDNVRVVRDLLDHRRRLSPGVRERLHVWTFRPGIGHLEAIAVNGMQRMARVVVQNSLREAFGLAVTEALWKGAVVLGAARGGIGEQIVDGANGLLTDDVDGGEAWSRCLSRALTDGARREWAAAAHDSVRRRYLVDDVVASEFRALDIQHLLDDRSPAAGASPPGASAPVRPAPGGAYQSPR